MRRHDRRSVRRTGTRQQGEGRLLDRDQAIALTLALARPRGVHELAAALDRPVGLRPGAPRVSKGGPAGTL